MNKKLLFLVNDTGFFLSHRLPLAKAAQQVGYDVHVATPASPAHDAILAQEGITHHAVPLSRGGMNPLAELRLLRAIVRLYRHQTPDIVHHVTVKPVIYGGIAARIAKIPAVVSAISGLGFLFISQGIIPTLRRALVHFLYRVALGHRNQQVIFQNPNDRDYFIQNRLIDAGKTTLIKGSGVDLATFQATSLPPSPPTIITLVARMLWDKGIGEFVEAIRQLKAQGLAVEAQLVGPIDPHNPAAIAQETLEAWQQEGVVNWLGSRADVPKLLAQSHIICLPSYREGLPKTLIEACAAGRPIVTTDVPGCRETVDPGRNGLLVPVRDVDALAKALAQLVGAPDTQQQMGQASREKAEAEFDVAQVAAQTMALYQQALAS